MLFSILAVTRTVLCSTDPTDVCCPECLSTAQGPNCEGTAKQRIAEDFAKSILKFQTHGREKWNTESLIEPRSVHDQLITPGVLLSPEETSKK